MFNTKEICFYKLIVSRLKPLNSVFHLEREGPKPGGLVERFDDILSS
eukprot:UN28107